MPDTVEMDAELVRDCAEACCGHVKALKNDSERCHKLIEALNLPYCKLNVEETDKLKALLSDFLDVFALDDSELAGENWCSPSIH